MTTDLLSVQNLRKYFPIKGGLFRRTVAHLKAVDDVSFSIPAGCTLGVVGESGCGKSTLGRAILRLHEPSSGKVLFKGADILSYAHRDMVRARRDMQIIFQDPYASLNPRMTIEEILVEPLATHRIGDRASRRKTIGELLDVVGMRTSVLNRYPHEFSGGQRQRIGIARALTLKPSFIVADEPVSALDVSVQSQVLNLISDLRRDFGISFLFIAHDLAVVQHISDQVAVMYLGKIVEIGHPRDLYRTPKHPYTEALLSAVPKPDPNNKARRKTLAGDVPSPIAPPPGCAFHERCPMAMERCRREVPQLRTLPKTEDSHGLRQVSCHLH